MFEDFVKNNAMEDEIKPSGKRIKANYSALRSLIEQEESMNNNIKSSKIFKKPFALAATIAVCVCLTSMTAFAASNGLFTSIKRAFYNDDNALRVSEPSEYAFIPNAAPIKGDGVTLNVTEAIADAHGLRIFMDMIYENGIPEKLLDYSKLTLEGIGFEKYEDANTDTSLGSYSSSDDDYIISLHGTCLSPHCVSIENNVVSLYLSVGGILENEWEKDGFKIGVENFGYVPVYTDADLPEGVELPDFEKVTDISGTINIPPEQIKRNRSVTAYSDIDGVPAKMDLSLLGIDITFNSTEDYRSIEDKISDPECGAGIITPWNIGVYMKDGTIYGKGNNMDKSDCLADGGSGTTNYDGTYHRYISFDMPVDVENIEKIEINDYEFCFN